MKEKPLPVPDRDSAPFWEGVRAGELRLQRCNGCGSYRWPARAICNHCHSFDTDWLAVSARGTVTSWVRTHQAFMRAFQDEIPYAVIQVQLDEQDDIQMIGRLADPGLEPTIGMRVRADFAPADGDPPLVVWHPIEQL
ncbi:MAG: hypothetical protein JWM91_3843 [Rhodospirillales bacterium]|nr:hypothetical protein [Rhodospirillales bacterium]